MSNLRNYPVFVLLSLATVVSAQEMGKDVKLQLATDNMFRGVVMTDGLVFQPSLDLSPSTGTHFRFMGSFPLSGAGGLDDIHLQFRQDINTIAVSGFVGVTRFQRTNGFASTTEIFGSATLPLVGITVGVHKDIDAVQGLYIRAMKSAPLPNFSFAGLHGGLRWESWLGYSDEKHAGTYYGHLGAGLADLAGRFTADFGVSQGTVEAWVQASTLLDPDYRSPGGTRSAITYGVSLRLKF